MLLFSISGVFVAVAALPPRLAGVFPVRHLTAANRAARWQGSRGLLAGELTIRGGGLLVSREVRIEIELEAVLQL